MSRAIRCRSHKQIRDRTGILTGAVGLIEVPEMASQILREGKADVVIFAREFLRRPYWPLEEARKLGVAVPWPAQYLRAAPHNTPAVTPISTSRCRVDTNFVARGYQAAICIRAQLTSVQAHDEGLRASEIPSSTAIPK